MMLLKIRPIVIFGFLWVILGVITTLTGYVIPIFYENYELDIGIRLQWFIYVIGII